MLPPGPRLPPTAQLALWIASPLRFLDDCARRHGEAFTLRLPRYPPFVVTSSPAHIKQIFTGDPDVLHAGEANEILRPLLGSRSLLLLDGADHLRERRLLLPPFHGERMHLYAEIMRDVTDASLDEWPVGRAMAVHPRLQGITLQVILRTVFGIEDGAHKGRLARRLARLLDRTASPIRMVPVLFQVDLFRHLPWLPSSQLKREVDRAILDEIAARRRLGEAGRGTDVLSLLLEARDETGAALGDGDLRDELVTLLVAGHETTATALAWALDRILGDAEVHARARDEVAAATGGGPLAPEALARMPWIDACVKETLRMRPIIPMVARRLTAPLQLGDWHLPAGTIVEPNIYLVHRRPDLYPEPDRFRPARFLDAKIDPYAWLPFGGGTRRCLGMAFALYEMKIVLATLLARARLRLAGGAAHAVRRGITLAPSGGARIVVESRRARVAAGAAAAVA